MLESKVVSQSNINNLDSHGNKLPTFIADISFVTTCSNIVVVSQIDIETQLFCNWLECGRLPKGLALPRVCTVNRSDFETGRHETENVLAETRKVSQSLL